MCAACQRVAANALLHGDCKATHNGNNKAAVIVSRRCGEHLSADPFKPHISACQQAKRAPPDSAPYDLSADLPRDSAGIEIFNARAAAVFSGEGLTACAHCGRSFTAAAFRNHKKICTAERPFKAAPAAASGGGAPLGGAGALDGGGAASAGARGAHRSRQAIPKHGG